MVFITARIKEMNQNIEEQISIVDPRAEGIVIEKLIRQCSQIVTLMKIGSIKPVGIAEVYRILTDFRYLIHHEFEEMLDCGCKELNAKWAKEDEGK